MAETVDPAAFDASNWSSVLGVGGGWFLAVLVVAAVFWLVLTGKLATKADLDKAERDVDTWRDAYWRERAAGDLDRQTVRDLTIGNKVIVRVAETLQSLPTHEETER